MLPRQSRILNRSKTQSEPDSKIFPTGRAVSASAVDNRPYFPSKKSITVDCRPQTQPSSMDSEGPCKGIILGSTSHHIYESTSQSTDSDNEPKEDEIMKNAEANPSNDPLLASSYKILEFLHLGTEESGSNVRYLCTNNIKYIVNLTGVSRKTIRSSLSCDCLEKKEHIPSEMVISIDKNTQSEELVKLFSKVNKMITEARKRGMQVLIFSSSTFQSSCQLIGLQYIMWYYQMEYPKARHHMENLRKTIQIPPNMENALLLWQEEIIHPKISSSTDHFVRRSAWQRERPTSMEDSTVSRRLAWL